MQLPTRDAIGNEIFCIWLANRCWYCVWLYSEIKHYDWLLQVKWHVLTNQGAFSQSRVVTLLWNCLMRSAPAIPFLGRSLCGTMGSGCGSVGRAVASDTRGPRFESSHRQKFILNICLLSTVYSKDENKEKDAGDGPLFKKKLCRTLLIEG